MQKEIEKILVDIIQRELDLPDNWGTTSQGDIIPCVTIYTQNIKLFNTEHIQITVKTLTARDFSNRIEYIENPNPTTTDGSDSYLEVQDLNQSRMMQIDVYSRNNEACLRFPEISMALNSTYARQQMNLYNFKLGTITNDNNLSGLDGDSDVNRFTLTFNILVHYQKIKPVNYYDKFELTLNTENGQFADISYPDNQ